MTYFKKIKKSHELFTMIPLWQVYRLQPCRQSMTSHISRNGCDNQIILISKRLEHFPKPGIHCIYIVLLRHSKQFIYLCWYGPIIIHAFPGKTSVSFISCYPSSPANRNVHQKLIYKKVDI